MKEGVSTLFIFAIIFSLTLISSSTLGIFEQDSTISLHQVCDNCSFVNLTSVTFPNGTIESIEANMTKIGQDYNFSFSNTGIPGLYIYNTCGDQDGILQCENIDFTINKLGEELTTGRGLVYILLTLLMFVLFCFALGINIILPFENERNFRGQITKIIRWKYVKIMMIPVTYGLFVWFLNLLLNISNSLIDKFDIYNAMISFLFSTFISLSWAVFVVCLVWVIFVFIRDLGWREQIKKFGKVMT